jgi:tRNA threonylcarbamoyladenosine biosynthesis protein TsaB
MLLALDTSTLTLSLALLEREGEGWRCVEEVRRGAPEKQSELLPGVVEALLQKQGVALTALEGIAVGLGPGSFTGLRIGVAAAKALAYAAQLPVGGASSLAAVALEGPEGVPLATLAVARKNELYLGTYRREGTRIVALEPERALTPSELAEFLTAVPEAQLMGPALDEYAAQLESLGVSRERMRTEARVPSAANIGRLATLSARGDLQALFALEPHYVRSSAAERDPKFPAQPGYVPTARVTRE